jgi:hypothetical protein
VGQHFLLISLATVGESSALRTLAWRRLPASATGFVSIVPPLASGAGSALSVGTVVSGAPGAGVAACTVNASLIRGPASERTSTS